MPPGDSFPQSNQPPRPEDQNGAPTPGSLPTPNPVNDIPQQPFQAQPMPQSVVMGSVPGYSSSTGSSGRKRMLAFVGIGAALLIGASASAYYFGMVVPNQPENVWKTAMTRTAQGYDELVEYGEKNKDIKGINVKGDYKLEGPYATDGTFEVQTHEMTSTFKADFGAVGSRITFEGRTLPAANSTNPDVYLKASGLKGLGSMLGDYAPLVQAYDDQWLFIDHTLFDNLAGLGGADAQQAQENSPLTADDVTKISETFGKVNRDYVFTTDSQKAVLTVVEQVGKEQKDGRSVYHYKVGLHKQHTKDYLNALVDSLQDTPITKLTDGKKVRDSIQLDELLKSVDNYKESDTADVYVDMSTKLIRAVRLVDAKDNNSFMEFGLNYNGGDVLPFVATWQGATNGQTGTMNASFNLNKKSNALDGNITYELPVGDGASEKMKFSMKYDVTPRTEALNVTKPEGAKSILELMGPVMSGLMSGSTSEDFADSLQI